MKKSDLKNGMIIELRKGTRLIIIENYAYSDLHDYSLNHFDNELNHYQNIEIFDIVKVFKIDREKIKRQFKNITIHELLTDEYLELIWQRNETDWSKVPFGTKVKVWDFEDDVKFEGKFLGYNEKKTHPYNVFIDTNKPKIWKNCELIEEPITYDELKEEFNKYCGGRRCTKCKYRTDTYACRYNYILQNYNVTRK